MLALIRCGGEPLASLAHPLRRGRSGRELPPCARGLLRYPARRRPLGVVVPALAAAFPDASRPEKLSRRALSWAGADALRPPPARAYQPTIPAAYRAARGPRGPDGAPPRAVARPPVAGETRCCGPSSRRGPLLAAQSWGASSPTFLSEHPGVRAGSSCAARRRLSRFPPDGGA